MNSFKIILLIILIINELYLIDRIIDGQRRGDRRKTSRTRAKSRNRNRGKSSEDPGIYCYTCYADFERVPLTVFNPVTYIYNNPCYNPALNYTLTDNEYLTKCSSTTKYCMVDVTRMNGVLISVDRRCGQSTCRKTCLSRGYGVIRETCTFCCGGRINEDHPDYDEEIHSVYKCPTEPH